MLALGNTFGITKLILVTWQIEPVPGAGEGKYAALQTTLLHMKRLNKTDSPIFVLCVFFVSKGNQKHFQFTSLQLVLSACSVSPYFTTVEIIFYLLLDHWTHSGYFENRIPLKPALPGVVGMGGGGVGCGGRVFSVFAIYIAAYETEPLIDFCSFVCLFFPKATF